jgi:hypothetical protein
MKQVGHYLSLGLVIITATDRELLNINGTEECKTTMKAFGKYV